MGQRGQTLRKPLVVGITMSLDANNLIREGVSYNFIRQEYGDQIRQAGAQPIFIDMNLEPTAAAELCDGIVISGGEDIDPSFYGHVPKGVTVYEPRQRTMWERRLIDACDTLSVPILGVCYGSQLLNVHYGGTLHQHIDSELGGGHHHEHQAGHSVMTPITFTTDFMGFTQEQIVTTAHRHHQAVAELAPGFQAAARADDGIIEAISGNGHYGIQWHAESDGTASQVYGEFVRYCIQRRYGTAYKLQRADVSDAPVLS